MVQKFSRNNKNLDCDSFIAHMYMYMLKKKKKTSMGSLGIWTPSEDES